MLCFLTILCYASFRRDNKQVKSPLSPAVDKLEILAAMLIKTDMSGLQDIPEQDEQDEQDDACTVVTEPVWFRSALKRQKKPGIPCHLPFRSDGETPCQDRTFSTFDNLKKHWRRFHSEEQIPKCPKGGKPEGYEDWEEDTGPMVMCR